MQFSGSIERLLETTDINLLHATSVITTTRASNDTDIAFARFLISSRYGIKSKKLLDLVLGERGIRLAVLQLLNLTAMSLQSVSLWHQIL